LVGEITEEEIERIKNAALDLQESLEDKLRKLTMSSVEYERYGIEAEYASMVNEIKKMAEESGQNFDDLLRLAAEWRDAELDALAKQIEDKTEKDRIDAINDMLLRCKSISDLQASVMAQYHDVDPFQQQARAAEDWIQGILQQFKDLGVVLWDNICCAMTDAQRAFRAVIDEIYTRQIYELRDALVETQKEVVSLWKEATRRIREQIDKIVISLANPQDILERMTILRGQISTYTGGQSVADFIAGLETPKEQQAALSDLQDLWGKYLEMAQEAYQRPSNEYQALYDEVLAELGAMEDIAMGYQTEIEVMTEQLEVLTSIREILDYIAFHRETIYGSGNIPGYQHGTDWVPRTGVYQLHQGEAVIPAEMNAESGVAYNVNFTVNESANPRNTVRMLRNEFETFIRGSKGRRMIMAAAEGKV